MTMMKLIRIKSTSKVTLGLLDNNWWTVEKPWVDLNDDGIGDENQSCIAEGVYTCKRHISPAHGDCFEIQNVVGRTHILFHVANWARDVKGCIGPGTGIVLRNDMVSHSRNAMDEMLNTLPDEFELEVINGF